MDAAFNLASCGKRCTVVSTRPFWNEHSDDPSLELAPYTLQRIRTAMSSPVPPRLLAPLRVTQVEQVNTGKDQKTSYLVHTEKQALEQDDHGDHHRYEGDTGYIDARQDEEPSESAEHGGDPENDKPIVLRTAHPPILCAGFSGGVSLGAAKNLFDFGGEDGCNEGSPILTLTDESTTTPGLFLVGPAVRHGDLSFCFLYKFRQRFGIVGEAIARGLGRDTADGIDECRKIDMYLDDFTSCKGACGQAC